MYTFTSSLVLLLVPGLPLLLAIGLILHALRRVTLLLVPWAAFPALVVSVSMTSGAALEFPWLLLGTHLGFDETARMFLFFTALLWLIASIYAKGYLTSRSSKIRFFTWFLLATSGNLGLILAQDMIIFYTFFALMSFASYALVVHERTLEALRACAWRITSHAAIKVLGSTRIYRFRVKFGLSAWLRSVSMLIFAALFPSSGLGMRKRW